MKPAIRPDYHPVVFHHASIGMDPGSMLASRSPRTPIDVAVGVLIALRRCSQQQGFQCLADAVHATGVGLTAVCHALITLAGGGTDGQVDPTAVKHWRHTIQQWAQADTTDTANTKAGPANTPMGLARHHLDDGSARLA